LDALFIQKKSICTFLSTHLSSLLDWREVPKLTVIGESETGMGPNEKSTFILNKVPGEDTPHVLATYVRRKK